MRRFGTTVLLTCLMFVPSVFASPARAVGLSVVRMYVFLSPECSHCEAAHKESLETLARQVGCSVEVQYFDIDNMVNYQKLVRLEEQYSQSDNEMPVVFIGKDVLSGEEGLKEKIHNALTKYAEAGGTVWPGDEALKADYKLSTAKSSHHSNSADSSPLPVSAALKAVPEISNNQDNPSIRSDMQLRPTKSNKLAQDNENRALEKTKAADARETNQGNADEHKPLRSQDPFHSGSVQHLQPTNIAASKHSDAKIYMALFYETTCKECHRIFYLMKYLQKKYPTIEYREFNLAERDNKTLNEAISTNLGVREKNRLIPATLFIGNRYFQEKDINLKKIQPVLSEYSEVGSTCPWDIETEKLVNAQSNIVRRFKSMGPITVALAGLIDGINPCAFTTLIFFVSYLIYLGHRGKKVLYVGYAFAAGMFIAYYLVGCGAASLLNRLSAYRTLSQGTNIVVAMGSIVLGVISFVDYLKARNGNMKEMGLQLPGFLKRKIHDSVRTHMKTSCYMQAAFAAGLTVSILELACTGQVYLPTIVFMTSHETLRHSALLYLALYNLMFTLPLIVIINIAYQGASSEKLARLSKSHIAPMKLAMSLIFMALGCFLILNSI